MRDKEPTILNRRELLALACAPAFIPRSEQRHGSLILLTDEDVERMRASLDEDERLVFESLANEALRAGPWSVTFHRPQGGLTGVGEHDYFSEGPYWWPNPKNPNGPYIRRDGERNPERFQDNHRDMDNMSSAALALGIGAVFLRKDGCVQHAERILATWFADAATRMNPNLEHGQAIRGVSDGRGTGLIDTVSLIHCVQGITLLELAGADQNVMVGVRQWFSEFLNWMTTSKKGLDEKKSGNNHATWWAAQVAAYASFVGAGSALRFAFDDYRDYLVPEEIRPDGSCPLEEGRTNSLSYSCFNLDAFSVLCRIAQVHSLDLWHFRASNGASIAQACDYLLPFMQTPATWKHEQMDAFNPDSIIFPGLAGLGLNSAALLHAYTSRQQSKNVWNQFVAALVNSSI